VTRRMAEAAAEISHWAEYEYVLVNADLEVSVAGLKSILTAERLKRERLRGLSDFVREMQKAL
jgi:guanylate kinase